MSMTRGAIKPALITIPSSDAAFRDHVQKLRRSASPADLETRLRRMFPRVVVRERTISGEAPAWYVYRDGAWGSSLSGSWWDDPDLPRVTVSPAGWIIEANATAIGLLGIEGDEPGTHHFTDFIVPGTLEDSIALFQIIGQGKELSATVLLRPTSGDVIAIDLHSHMEGSEVIGVFRLADDVEISVGGAPAAGPTSIEYVPEADSAFRGYARRALGRMPEPTAGGLELRLRRLYPHATVVEDGDRWVARRDRGKAREEGSWWLAGDLPMVRYDAQALILEANEAAQTYFGRPMVGHHWQEFVTPGSTEQVTVMLEILAEAGAAESRFRMPRGDGSLVEFDSYTQVRSEEFVTVFRPAGEGA
jgi:PAS domain-containing protein